MEEREPDVQPPVPPDWKVVLTYVGAFAAGVVLIASGHASTTEASGYVGSFLVLYERRVGRRPDA